MKETEFIHQPVVPEKLKTEKRLTSVYLPDLGGRVQFDEVKAEAPDKVRARLEVFLQELNARGAKFIGLVPVLVEVDSDYNGTQVEQQYLAIIEE